MKIFKHSKGFINIDTITAVHLGSACARYDPETKVYHMRTYCSVGVLGAAEFIILDYDDSDKLLKLLEELKCSTTA